MTPSKILLYICLSFVAGVFVNSLIKIPQLLVLGFLILGILLISVLWPYKKIVVVGFCVLFLVFGIWRHQFVASTRPGFVDYNNRKEKIILTGIVAEEPDMREKSQKITIDVKPDENISRPASGRALVTANRYPEYGYGDKLEITGELKTPSEDIGGFNYRDYLRKDGIYSVMDFPKIKLSGSGFGNPIMEVLFSFKNKFKETAEKFISPPQIGILEALALGDESEMSKEWKDKLNLTGTRHIAAVSGMNITIISGIILNFLLLLGLWRKHAFYLSLAVIILFVLMIGAPASAARAGVMAGLFLTAQHFGRVSAASRAVIFAATFMIFLNPLLLRLDVGFQLSFLAVLGIIYLQPIFSLWLRKIPNYKLFPLRTTISATLSAQVFASPILLFNFGYVSLISLFANILIAPFLAPITVLIFIFGFLAILLQPLGAILSFPVWLALSYMLKVIDIFSKIPLAALKLENLSWIWLITSYSVLSFIVFKLRRFARPGFLR